MFFGEVTEVETSSLTLVLVAIGFVVAAIGTGYSIRANAGETTRSPNRRNLWLAVNGPQPCSYSLSSGIEVTADGVVRPPSGVSSENLAASIEVSTTGTRLCRSSSAARVWINDSAVAPERSVELAAGDHVAVRTGDGLDVHLTISSQRLR